MVGRWLGAHSALGQARGTVLKWLLDAGDKQVGGRRGGAEEKLDYTGNMLAPFTGTAAKTQMQIPLHRLGIGSLCQQLICCCMHGIESAGRHRPWGCTPACTHTHLTRHFIPPEVAVNRPTRSRREHRD